MKKKLLSVLLAVSVLASMSACGSQETPKQSETAVSEQSQSDTAASENEPFVPSYPIVDEPITVTGLTVGADTSVSESRIIWDKVEEVTGIKVEWVNIDPESFSTYLAGNEWPDFFHTNKFSTSQVNDYGIVGERFVNYLDYLNIMPNLAKTYKDYPAALAASTQLNGEVYNLFQVNGGASTAVSARPHVRLDVLKAAGITELPTTIDEFYDQLKILKEKNGEPSMILDTGVTAGYTSFLFSSFGKLHNLNFDDDGTNQVVYSRVTDQMKYYYQFLNKLYDEELMNREWLTMADTSKTQYAKSGKVAFLTQSASQFLGLEDLNGDWNNLGCLAPLTSEYDDTRTLAGVIDYRPVAGMYLNKDSQYVEEICRMFDIAFATEEVTEGSNLIGHSFCYGFEDVDWKINDDNTYEQIVPESFASFTAYQEQALRWQALGRADKFGSAITSTAGNAQVRQKGYISNVIPYMIKEHVFPIDMLKYTEEEQYIIDNKYGDIRIYVEEMAAKFISGVADTESDWDEYVATCEKMGLKEVIEVNQAVYDRWNDALNKLN